MLFFCNILLVLSRNHFKPQPRRPNDLRTRLIMRSFLSHKKGTASLKSRNKKHLRSCTIRSAQRFAKFGDSLIEFSDNFRHALHPTPLNRLRCVLFGDWLWRTLESAVINFINRTNVPNSLPHQNSLPLSSSLLLPLTQCYATLLFIPMKSIFCRNEHLSNQPASHPASRLWCLSAVHHRQPGIGTDLDAEHTHPNRTTAEKMGLCVCVFFCCRHNKMEKRGRVLPWL